MTDAGERIVSVLVFGPMARAANAKQLTLRAQGPAMTCGTLREQIQRQFPPLAPMLKSCRFAVDGAFVEDTLELKGTEEIALIGLVSGG
jgi:molybdopterin converting factor small subunit